MHGAACRSSLSKDAHLGLALALVLRKGHRNMGASDSSWFLAFMSADFSSSFETIVVWPSRARSCTQCNQLH